MCGIFAFFGNTKVDLASYANKIKHRGPDNTVHKQINEKVYFHFHRLMINGLSTESNQPFHIKGIWLMCNGEIYNYKTLDGLNGFQLHTKSDCEIILHMYLKYGIVETCKKLDGVFSFALYDEKINRLYVARDHLGIRPLYIGRDEDGNIGFASEAKALTFMTHIEQFPPRTIWTSGLYSFNSYYKFPNKIKIFNEEKACRMIKWYLDEAVSKRFLMTDVEVGCLLSGGLDSSLVTSICSRLLPSPKDLKTFSIGLKGSPDLLNAKSVADFLGTNHFSYEVSEQEFLDAIRDTIYCLGSYDITTVRASVGHMLISRYVSRDTDVKVLFSGEVADEMGSYLYFMNAPDKDAYREECFRLLQDIHYFDGLRSDRSISYAGIESRVPFSDKDFMALYLSIDTKLKLFNDSRIEKYLIRKAYADFNYLPDSVLWRRKNGFSDSVSSKTRSWSTIIQEHVNTLVSDEEFKTESVKYRHNQPQIKEAYYYRKVFCELYNEDGTREHSNIVPYMWLPKWCGDVKDPSARVLDIYEAD